MACFGPVSGLFGQYPAGGTGPFWVRLIRHGMRIMACRHRTRNRDPRLHVYGVWPEGRMSKSEAVEKLSLKARVCRDLAEAAPTEAERKYWLERADEFAEQVRPSLSRKPILSS